MINIFTELSWLAIIVGTIAYCAFCGIWHRQFVFGKTWEKAMGFDRPENWKETNIYYVVPLIACFITTIAIATILKLTNATSILDAVKVGSILGVGFGMAIVFTTAVIPTMKNPLKFGAITGTAQALGILLVTIIIHLISN